MALCTLWRAEEMNYLFKIKVAGQRDPVHVSRWGVSRAAALKVALADVGGFWNVLGLEV